MMEQSKNAKEGMDASEKIQINVRIKTKKIKRTILSGTNYDNMMTENIRELTTIKKTNEITSEQIITLV